MVGRISAPLCFGGVLEQQDSSNSRQASLGASVQIARWTPQESEHRLGGSSLVVSDSESACAYVYRQEWQKGQRPTFIAGHPATSQPSLQDVVKGGFGFKGGGLHDGFGGSGEHLALLLLSLQFNAGQRGNRDDFGGFGGLGHDGCPP